MGLLLWLFYHKSRKKGIPTSPAGSARRPVAAANFAQYRWLAQSPPCERGVPRHRRGGGIPWPRPRNLFTIHYSLFPKKPSPFHTGLYFGGVPTVNPSVTAAPCQLPLTREPFCAWYRHCLKSKNPGKQRLSRGFSYFRREFPTKTGLDFPKQAGLFLLPGMILPPFPGKNQQGREKTL